MMFHIIHTLYTPSVLLHSTSHDPILFWFQLGLHLLHRMCLVVTGSVEVCTNIAPPTLCSEEVWLTTERFPNLSAVATVLKSSIAFAVIHLEYKYMFLNCCIKILCNFYKQPEGLHTRLVQPLLVGHL